MCYITDDSNTGAEEAVKNASPLASWRRLTRHPPTSALASSTSHLPRQRQRRAGQGPHGDGRQLSGDMFTIGIKTDDDFTLRFASKATVVRVHSCPAWRLPLPARPASTAYVGASAWRKLEGITWSEEPARGGHSSKRTSFKRATMRVGIEKNTCGCVYRAPLDANNRIKSISPLICGVPTSFNTGDKLGHCEASRERIQASRRSRRRRSRGKDDATLGLPHGDPRPHRRRRGGRRPPTSHETSTAGPTS